MKFKILWFDDEHEDFEIFKNRAKNKGLLITAVETAHEGLELLKDASKGYEAIILDGLFFKKEGDNLDDVKKQAFGEVMKHLSETKSKHYIPCFVYSGQTSFTKEENELLDHYASDYAGSKTVYDKLNPEDEGLLFNDILDACRDLESARIKIKYADVFQIFQNGHLDHNTEVKLLDLILSMESDGEESGPQFTSLRKIIERLVDRAEELKLIPSEIGTANLTRAVGFLCNCDNDYKLYENYFHPTINFFLPVLVNILQDGSHSKNGMRYKADDFAISRDNGYFFKSCLYQILDVLIAFNNLFQKKEQGRLAGPLWNKLLEENIFEGPLEQDAKGNYHCGEYLLPYKVVDKTYKEGQVIRILAEDENTNDSTRNYYPKFAVKFEALN